MERNVWIPRNLIEEDYIKFAFGVKIRPSDMPIMGLAAAGISPFTNGLEDFYKYSAYFIGCVGAYYLARISYRGQYLPELLFNVFIYNCRKHRYTKRGKKNDIQK